MQASLSENVKARNFVRKLQKQIPLRIQELNERAIFEAQVFNKAEGNLISIFEELIRTQGYLYYDVTNVTDYGIQVLKLSESAAVNLSIVSRKAIQFPELKEAVQKGEISISKARRISSVLTDKTKDQLIEFAKTSSSRAIEKEVARINPLHAIPEKLKYKTAERLELSLGVSEGFSQKLQRAKDLLAQKRRESVSSEHALEAALDALIEKFDPIKKAERSALRKSSQAQIKVGTCQPVNYKRTNIHSALKHAVTLRDLRQCAHIGSNGIRCNNKRWLDVHHIVPISRGGNNELSNLTTLCSAHHKFLHRH